MRALALALAACLAAAALSACGGKPPARGVERPVAEAHWQDVFETVPELLVVVRPQALEKDRVYGPLLRRAIETARRRSPVVAATRFGDAIEDAEEVIAGLRPDTRDTPGEMVLVARGVRADLDPGKLVDDGGRPLFAPGPSGAVRELVRERDEHGHPVGASLFELPGRTWVLATGPARQRARDAFAHPLGRPPMDLDPEALALVRIDGPSLVARVHVLDDQGDLAAVGRRLSWVLLALPPGADKSVTATFAYADEDAAAFAEVAAREAIGAVARAGSKRASLAWLAPATVERPDKEAKRVVITAPLPARLVDVLLAAGQPDLL